MRCDVTSVISAYYSSEITEETEILNFCKRSYQPIFRYFYAETIKRRGKISLHKHFNNNISYFFISSTDNNCQPNVGKKFDETVLDGQR